MHLLTSAEDDEDILALTLISSPGCELHSLELEGEQVQVPSPYN